MSFLPLFLSRFEMRSSNSVKILSLDKDTCLMDTYPVDITSIFCMIGVRHSKSQTEIMWKMSWVFQGLLKKEQSEFGEVNRYEKS